MGSPGQADGHFDSRSEGRLAARLALSSSVSGSTPPPVSACSRPSRSLRSRPRRSPTTGLGPRRRPHHRAGPGVMSGEPTAIGGSRPGAGTGLRPVGSRSAGAFAKVVVDRAFDIDMQHCPNRGAGALKVIAAVLERPVIGNLLEHLGLQARSPPTPKRPARKPGPPGRTSPPEPRPPSRTLRHGLPCHPAARVALCATSAQQGSHQGQPFAQAPDCGL